MKVTTQKQGQVIIAHLAGEIDTIDTEGLGDTLQEIVAEKPGGVVLDFAQVSYIASVGIGILIKLAQDLRKIKCPVVIANVSPAVRTVLDTVHLTGVIPVVATVEEGCKKVAS